MNHHLRSALEVIAFIIVVSLIWIAIPAPAHATVHTRESSVGIQAAACLNPSPKPAPTDR